MDLAVACSLNTNNICSKGLLGGIHSVGGTWGAETENGKTVVI